MEFSGNHTLMDVGDKGPGAERQRECSTKPLGSRALLWSSAPRVLAHLGEIERGDSAVIIQEDVYCVQSPSTFSQET